MEIKQKENVSGFDHLIEYSDADSFDTLNPKECRQAYGVCFYGDKLVIGYNGKKGTWNLIGGTIESGETFVYTLKREIQEESNMEVLSCLPIGYQKATNLATMQSVLQLRYVCIVKPFGDFIEDPSGSVSEIKLIDPAEYKKYFDWGGISDRIISRALELKTKLK